MNNAVVSSIGFVFLAVAVATAAIALFKIKKALASATWPSVFGELESAELRKVVYQGVESKSISDQASALVVDFKYQYSVESETFVGNRVTFSDGVNKTTRSLKKLQQRYEAKKRISVYYNPQKPSESVLIPGTTIFNFSPLITSSLFALVAIYLFSLDV